MCNLTSQNKAERSTELKAFEKSTRRMKRLWEGWPHGKTLLKSQRREQGSEFLARPVHFGLNKTQLRPTACHSEPPLFRLRGGHSKRLHCSGVRWRKHLPMCKSESAGCTCLWSPRHTSPSLAESSSRE